MDDAITPPLLIEAVECSPGGYEKVIVRVTGKWQGSRKRGADARPVLTVQKDGSRHQFRAMPEARRPRISRPGSWAANFVLPTWLEPRLGGEMSLWVGEAEIVLPTGPPVEHVPPNGHPAQELPDLPAAQPKEALAPNPAPRQRPTLRRTQLPAPKRQAVTPEPPGRPAAPTAPDHDARESELEATVKALRAELHERAGADARDRARLADVQAELKSRVSREQQLEEAQTELRTELRRLQELVEQDHSVRVEHVAELSASLDRLAVERDGLRTHLSALRSELASARVAREAAESEAIGWRAEVERLSGELALAREEAAGHDGGLGEAQELLAQARALRTRIQREDAGVAAAAVDAA